eukprot:2295767-Pyramimonas_sp.AAC.1
MRLGSWNPDGPRQDRANIPELMYHMKLLGMAIVAIQDTGIQQSSQFFEYFLCRHLTTFSGTPTITEGRFYAGGASWWPPRPQRASSVSKWCQTA